MPLELPDLDDRTFTDLVEEALAMIPHHAPTWTHHNPSDPGITLIELLAYFTEMLIYRLDQVGRENQLQFLRLLNGPDWDARPLAQSSLAEVKEALGATVQTLRQPQRAVTQEDFEYLARQAILAQSGDYRLVRTHCAIHGNLDAAGDERERKWPGHVSVVVLPGQSPDSIPPESQDFAPLLDRVRQCLAPKCLLTTRLHVVQPCYLWISLGVVVHPYAGTEVEAVRRAASAALRRYFSPFGDGGPSGEGWPFGRSVYLSEVFAVLEQVADVDHIEAVRVLSLAASEAGLRDERAAVGIQIGIRSTVGVDSRLGAAPTMGRNRLLRGATGALYAIGLDSHELVGVVVRDGHLRFSNNPTGFVAAG